VTNKKQGGNVGAMKRKLKATADVAGEPSAADTIKPTKAKRVRGSWLA
jgi:hypothetical protein